MKVYIVPESKIEEVSKNIGRDHYFDGEYLRKTLMECKFINGRDVFGSRIEREILIDKLSTLINTESVRLSPAMVDMVYSYRIAQIIEELRGERQND